MSSLDDPERIVNVDTLSFGQLALTIVAIILALAVVINGDSED